MYGVEMKLSEIVAKRIRELLDERDMSQNKLAKISTIHPGTLNDLMYGENKAVNLRTVHLIIKAFQITYGEFFGSSIFDDNSIDID